MIRRLLPLVLLSACAAGPDYHPAGSLWELYINGGDNDRQHAGCLVATVR